MIERSLLALGPHGFYRMAYAEWGEAERVVVCVHGLTRNGRDFDALAAALAAAARVVCPDMPGRGRSDDLSHGEDYTYPTYLGACATLIARIGANAVDWVGTSMGGIIGMLLAALPGTPIRRLVLNDVGAVVAAEGLRRLATYVGHDPTFAGMPALEMALRRVAAPFGPLTDAQWAHLARYSARTLPDGRLGWAYDPRIGDAFRGVEPQDVDLWAPWDAIRAPTLILRGAESDILRHDDAVAMTQRGPPARLVELPGIGHAPALMAADQIGLIREFLTV
jgi:pimeloyl-ACP methyl ester carboxylesterase